MSLAWVHLPAVRCAAETAAKRLMRPRSGYWFSAALAPWLLPTAAAQAQVISFQGYFGPGLAPEDSRPLFESVARLNAAEPGRALRGVEQAAAIRCRLPDAVGDQHVSGRPL
jgi:hypothetical protein